VTRIVRHHRSSACELAALRVPRLDLLVERSVGDDRWEQQEGPFTLYRRSLEVGPESGSDGMYDVTETIDFKLAIPLWSPIFRPLMKRALADPDRRPRSRWWWGRDVIPAHTTTLLSVVAIIGVVAGYLGVVIGQTITFATQEFGSDQADQGWTLAGVRIGVLLSVVFLRVADRVGRKPLLIGFTVVSVLFTAAGAFSTGMLSLGISQALARGLATGLLTLITLAATEEVPAAIRSRSIGLVTLATGLGASMVIWVLPVADLGPGGWRIVYLVPLLSLPVLWWASRTLPETRRFSVARTHLPPATVSRKWFVLLAVAAFASALFLSPSSQFMNEYLNTELGYSAAEISVFRLLVYSPIAIFVLGAGFLADRIGRRPVAVTGLAFGAVGSAAVFYSDGLRLWVSAMVGGWFLAAAYTALRGYQTELFPTRTRARVGGWLDGISVAGSALGLIVAGELSSYWGRLGPGIAVLLVGPMIVLVLVIIAFPETARIELEEFNPEDPTLDHRAG
jgi:MFS family permease